ncbi:hypothetical protein K488DRAFT_52224 [Vararia minispora EC-137]|uniref:Uncharacterized protein n=1 Tax=Vararia minispora EC-137 TaxID=1314806 RepID=A0ACB8QIB3_9AGAM|nr:hypothetical protein K488DRAFT_52224 [Vararia minispora EC-137]
MFASRPNRALLNPKFEGYKLDAVDEASVLRRQPLPYKPKQTTTSSHIPLSFREVQSRIRHNHLVSSPDLHSVFYIDGELRVVQVSFDDKMEPTCAVVFELPAPMVTDEAGELHREYASVAFAGHNAEMLFVTDGCGTLYTLMVGVAEYKATLSGTHNVPFESDAPRPFKIHTSARVDADSVILLVSAAVRLHDSSKPASVRATVEYDIYALQILLSKSDLEKPKILWHLRGADAPLYSAYAPEHAAFLLIGSEPYRSLTAPPRLSSPELSEQMPLPRTTHGDASRDDTTPPPYAWTQDEEEVTVAFPLPASTSSSAISVLFAPQSLTLRAPGAPSLSTTKLWAPIAPSSSFWTWDAAGSTRYGLLTLHIEKSHAHTRWASLFAENAATSELEVPETLDASALAHIRDALEKFTASAAEQVQNPLPSLASGELDDELDADAGARVVLSWVRASDGQPIPEPWAQSDADCSLSVLSTPLPGTSGLSLIVKHTLDGLFFTRNDHGTWTHARTHPALAFVLASKRDVRFVHHLAHRGVLALEAGAATGGGNAYIYRASGTHALHAPQAILRVAGATAGTLLGVAAVRVGGGDEVAIVCLCENDLVILRDVL